jgi:hypothetical protein
MTLPDRPDERECALLRAYEPRGANEHAMLVQLPEFYSQDPSSERLRSIAHDVARATEDERRAMGRAVIEGLCPETGHPLYGVDIALVLALVLLVLVLVSWKKK